MMKKLFILLFVTCLLTDSFAQKGDYIRPSALGVSFSLTDYTTAQRIRNTSLSTVINRKQRAKFKDMAPGLAVSYFKGLRDHIDFVGTLNGTFVSVPIEGQTTTSNDQFSLESDASVNLKLFSDKYIFTPYLSVGIGISTYDSEFGAFLPLGGGLKLNLFDEAAIFVNSQYRVPVITETGNYHFFHSFGIAGVIGKKKEATVTPAP
jgi:hypothetical protein